MKCSHQWWHGWPQQVTLVLNILDETVEERGVGLCLCLSIGEEGDAVLAHVNAFLERFQFRHTWITSRERHHVVTDGGFPAYLLWSLLFGGVVFGVLRVKQQGHVEKERRLVLGKVNLGHFIGQQLLVLPDLNFSQSRLLRLTQPNGSTHHTGILLKDTHHSDLNQQWGHVCSYIADADKLDDPIFKAHMTFLIGYSRWECGGGGGNIHCPQSWDPVTQKPLCSLQTESLPHQYSLYPTLLTLSVPLNRDIVLKPWVEMNTR